MTAAPPPQLVRAALPAPDAARVASRTRVWGAVAWSFQRDNLAGWLSGETSHAHRAQRLRAALQTTGGTALKIAEIMSLRLDLLPFEHCVALATLEDQAPHLDASTVAAQVQAELGEAVELQPTRSTTSGTWFRGTAAARDITVFARRPEAVETLVADVAAMRRVLEWTDWLTVLPQGFAGQLAEELRAVIASELDLRSLARHHRLLPLFADQDRLPRVDVAEVLASTDSLLITERSAGVPLQEVLDAVDDEVAAARLLRLRIEPRKVARRLTEASWWSTLECPFFHGPRVEDVLVRPGNALVFLNLSAVGHTTGHARRMHRELMRRLVRQDVAGAADAVVQALSPLPWIDTHAFTRALEHRLARVLLALRDPSASSSERGSGPLWTAILEVCQQHRVPLRLDLIRMMRAARQHHELAVRLDPQLNLLEQFARYTRRADDRRARNTRDALQAAAGDDIRPLLLARAAEAADQIERVGFFVDAIVANPPVQHISLTGKAAHTARELLGLGSGLLVVVLLGMGLHGAWSLMVGGGLALGVSLWAVLSHPIFGLLAGLGLLLTVRRIRYRLADTESDG